MARIRSMLSPTPAYSLPRTMTNSEFNKSGRWVVDQDTDLVGRIVFGDDQRLLLPEPGDRRALVEIPIVAVQIGRQKRAAIDQIVAAAVALDHVSRQVRIFAEQLGQRTARRGRGQ